MIEKRRLRPRGAGRLQMVGLLLVLGLDFRRTGNLRRQRICKAGFWERQEGDLPFILWDARRAYRTLMKQCHPDLGGDGAGARELNGVWNAIKRRFGRKGIKLSE